MPTYQFRCPDGTIIERIFKISEVPASIPAPDGSDAVRIISGGAGLIFKGTGFYITDYGKDGKKDQRDAAAKPETKTETKAAGSDSPAPSATPKTESSSSGSSGTSDSGGSKE